MLRAFLVLVCLAASPALAQTDASSRHDGRRRRRADHADQAGQSAFAAIQEIVAILEADPKTDWSKVEIEALRQHLIDMDAVTLRAESKSEPVDGGMRFVVTGAGPVKDSIRRMVFAHAATMNGVGGWRMSAAEIDDGATLTVIAPAKDAAKLQRARLHRRLDARHAPPDASPDDRQGREAASLAADAAAHARNDRAATAATPAQRMRNAIPSLRLAPCAIAPMTTGPLSSPA